MSTSLWKYFCIVIYFVFLLSSPAYATNTLKMLIWEGYAPPEQVEKFQTYIKQKYGKAITLEISHKVSDVCDFFDALRERKFHIISPAHNVIKDERFGLIRNKLIAPINLDNIPNYKTIIPALQKADYITDDEGNVYGVPILQGPYGLAYNTKYIKTPPQSWNILWDNKFTNRYAISADYYECNFYITALAMGLTEVDLYDFDTLKTNTIFMNKLRHLAQNAKSLWKGVDTADDLEGLALATTWGFCLDDLEKRGESWKMAEPQEGMTGYVDNFLMSYELVNNPFLKTVAEEWMNYILGSEYQINVVVRQLGSAPVNTELSRYLSKEEIEKHHLDEPNYFAEKRWLWPIFKTRRERNVLKYAWSLAIRREP